MTLAERLADATAAERLAAIEELAACRTTPAAAEIAALRECLADDRKAVQRRAAEVFARLARDEPAVREELHRILTGEGWRLRWGAAFALSLVGPLPVAALPALIDALAADDGDVRWAAAERLKELASREPGAVMAELLPVALDGPAPQRKMALYCLRDLNAPEAVAVAETGLQASDVGVRLAALAAFARLADRAAAAERIVALLGDPDERIRRAAAATLGSLGVALPAVLAALEEAGRSPDPSLRRAADQSRRRLSKA